MGNESIKSKSGHHTAEPSKCPDSIELYFLGGAMEIGGSCIFIKAAGKRLLLDCGIRQTQAKDPLPDFRTIQEQGGLDAIIISHAHMDHIGTLPIISKAYPLAPIYMTAMTADLTRVLLYDSLKIMKYREDEIPHYSEQDVLNMLSRIIPVRFQTPFPILDGITLTLYPAGHIAGAACIYLVTDDGTIFYSGDFAAFSQRTIEGIHIPKLRPDIAILETTYGRELHANRQAEERRLVDLVRECMEEKQKILIPAFALGRAQEVQLILRSAIQNQEIPSVPIYVDGMVRDINIMYTRNPTFLKNNLGKRILKGNEPFYTKEIQPVAQNQKRDDLLKGKDPVILISSSGMLTGGPSAQYARQLAPQENACIIITGYQDEESPGRQLLNLLSKNVNSAPAQIMDPSILDSCQKEICSDRKLTIDGVTIPVKCRIEQVGLSAHGDKSEITALLQQLSPRNIFLVHGNEDVIQELGAELSAEDFRRHVYLPECGQGYRIPLHTKRRQLTFHPAYTLQRTSGFTAEDAPILWDYWQEHYYGKRFAVSQIAYIWYGKPITEESILQDMQNVLQQSPYFSMNARQLFLFEPDTAENIAQTLAPKEWTMQDLEPVIQALFHEYNYRKIGYHRETREILMLFDYPDSIEQEKFSEKAAEFKEQTGWVIRINPSMNFNAAGALLQTLFPGRLQKTSYYQEKKCYAVTVSEIFPEDTESSQIFCQTTGWKLNVNGNFLNASVHSDIAPTLNGDEMTDPREFLPSDSAPAPLEQNLTFSCIGQEFAECPHQAEKISLKNDSCGKYLELAFITPTVGFRYRGRIQSLADQTGWRIRIADKTNQNMLFQIAQMLCAAYQITLAKNPSYLPGERTVVLKTRDTVDPNTVRAISEEFDEKTGCQCKFINL